MAEEKKKKDEEYAKKRAERKKREAEEAKEKEEGVIEHGGEEAQRKKPDHKTLELDEKREKAVEVKKDDKKVLLPGDATPGSNVKVKNGEVIEPPTPVFNLGEVVEGAIAKAKFEKDNVGFQEEDKQAGQVAQADNGGAGNANDEKKPVAEQDNGKGRDKEERDNDKKHETKGKKVDPPKHQHEHDPSAGLAEAELLAKMMGLDGGIDELKLAFRAIEAAAKGVSAPTKQLLWTWKKSCEKWRWRSFEADVDDIAADGWEARDWVVFADGHTCEAYEKDQARMEVLERDVHDWSL